MTESIPEHTMDRSAKHGSLLTPGANFDGWKATGRSIVCEDKVHHYRAGQIETPLGIVGLYDQPGVTRLDFVFSGRCHTATWERTFTDRFLITLARRFAEKVVSDAH